MNKRQTILSFPWIRKNLQEVLVDKSLASLGDSYINFVYSLVMSRRIGKPFGTKVKGSLLAEAVRKAGLRKALPSRMSRHALADGAEALIAYGWLNGHITLHESVLAVESSEELTEGLAKLLETIEARITFP